MVRKGSNLPFRGQRGKVRKRRVSPIAPNRGEGLSTELTPAVRPWSRERVFISHSPDVGRGDGAATSGQRIVNLVCRSYLSLVRSVPSAIAAAIRCL